jgi:polar amino acid transport system substrate-binding protein
MTDRDDPAAAARAALRCRGALRVALNLSNSLLVSRGGSRPKGLAPTLAEWLAAALDMRLEFVCYDTPGRVVDDAGADAWSLAFIAADPQRAAAAVFSEPYAGIEASCLVAPDSPLRELAAVDAPGHAVASFRGSAYDLWLQQHLKHAARVPADTPAAAAELLRTQRADVLAGLRVHLAQEARRWPGSRVLDGCLMTVQQAIALPRRRAAALPFVDGFLRREKASGRLGVLIERLALPGLAIRH